MIPEGKKCRVFQVNKHQPRSKKKIQTFSFVLKKEKKKEREQVFNYKTNIQIAIENKGITSPLIQQVKASSNRE